MVHWDNDGRKDLLIGRYDGRVQIYLNVNTDAAPAFGTGSYLQFGPPGARRLRLLDWSAAEKDRKPVPLATQENGVEQWKWSPDGRGILYVAAEKTESVRERLRRRGFDFKLNDPPAFPRNVWQIEVPDGRTQRLTSFSDAAVRELEPSSDGRYWALTVRPAERYATAWDNELYLLDREDGVVERLTDNSQPEGSPKFSPDGKWLAYVAPHESRQYAARKAVLQLSPVHQLAIPTQVSG